MIRAYLRQQATKKSFKLRAGTAFFVLFAATSPAYAGSINEVSGPTGWTNTYLSGISNNFIIVGNGEDPSTNYKGFVWENGVATDLGTFGGLSSTALGISGDGTTILGVSQHLNGVDNEAFYYRNGVMTGIGYLGSGNYSQAQASSTDGNVIVGRAFNGTENHAFRWESGVMVDLGTIGGGSFSEARDVSGDGSIVIGINSPGAGFTHGFRWEAGVMTSIGGLSTFGSEALAISTDGTTIVGNSYNGSITEAFQWVNGTMTGLGYIDSSGFDYSYASYVSADGSVIAGESDYKAVIWSNGTLKTLNQVLSNAGVNMSGWTLETTAGLTDDGEYVIGYGQYQGSRANYIANITGGGLITPGELAESLSSATLSSSQSQSLVQSGLTQTLSIPIQYIQNTAQIIGQRKTMEKISVQSIEPAAGGDDTLRLGYRRGFYATGTFGVGQNGDFSNREGSGTIGALFMTNSATAFGGGLIGGATRDETRLGGHSSSTTKGVSLMAAHNMAGGWKLSGTAALADIDVSSNRHYMNGAAVDVSNGKTDGYAYGVAARFGKEWQYDDKHSVMPYAQLDVTRTHLDAYTEQGGAFAASYTAHSHTSATSRLGVEGRQAFNDKINLRGHVAWAHRLTGEDDVTATAALITQTLSTNSGARDWIEAGVGSSYRLNDATHLTADLDGHLSKNSLPAVSATVGMIWNF